MCMEEGIKNRVTHLVLLLKRLGVMGRREADLAYLADVLRRRAGRCSWITFENRCALPFFH